MVRLSWKLFIGGVLLVSTLLLAVLHILVFKDPSTLLFYLALDVVFVPVQVLLVSMIIEQLLNEREKQAMLIKMNMVIGAFFCEAGNRLLHEMGSTCVDFPKLGEMLRIDNGWDQAQYRSAQRQIDDSVCRFDAESHQLQALRDSLRGKRNFILTLLQNQNLLENKRFTDLLWAICHLSEELDARADLDLLPASDVKHLEGDVERAFAHLVREWLLYMQHLKLHYPYMYSLCIRTNPFNPNASAIVSA